MSMKHVPPPATSAAEPVGTPSQEARPGSLKCTWASSTPGNTCRPRASIVSRAGTGDLRGQLGDPAALDADIQRLHAGGCEPPSAPRIRQSSATLSSPGRWSTTRGDQQGHVVVRLRVVDHENHGHLLQEPPRIALAARAEVLPHVEDELVGAGLQLSRLPAGERPCRPPALVATLFSGAAGPGFLETVDAHSRGRHAAGGVQDVRAQPAHVVTFSMLHSLVIVPLIRPYGSLVATKISLGLSMPNGFRLTSSRCWFGMLEAHRADLGAARQQRLAHGVDGLLNAGAVVLGKRLQQRAAGGLEDLGIGESSVRGGAYSHVASIAVAKIRSVVSGSVVKRSLKNPGNPDRVVLITSSPLHAAPGRAAPAALRAHPGGADAGARARERMRVRRARRS